MKPNHLLDVFRERYGDADFPRRDWLLAGLRTGECVIHHGPDPSARLLPCRHYLSTYRTRMRRLSRCETDYAWELLREVSTLCEELAKSPDEPVQLWIFKVTDGSAIILFAGGISGRLLGSFRAFEQDRIPPEEWDALWNGSTSPDGPGVEPGE